MIKKNILKNRKITITGLITVSSIIIIGTPFLTGCSGSQKPSNESETTTESSVSEASQSTDSEEKKEEKNITLKVVDNEGKVSEYDEKTDAEYLREVMDELSDDADFTYSGSESQYGLYIDTINGVRADYDNDGAYWAIYVNGNYANYGIDSQPVSDGDTFELKYEAN